MTWFLVGFVMGSFMTCGALLSGWYAHKRIIHKPKMREMFARIAELERIVREQDATEQRARENEGQ